MLEQPPVPKVLHFMESKWGGKKKKSETRGKDSSKKFMEE